MTNFLFIPDYPRMNFPQTVLLKPRLLRAKMLVLLILLGSISSNLLRAEEKTPAVNVDFLTTVPSNWELTPEAFEQHLNQQQKGLFRWLTKDRSRAKLSRTLYSNMDIKLSFLDEKVPVEEVVVDFSNGKLNLVTLSIFNRGDGENITLEDFKTRQMAIGKALSVRLATKAMAVQANRQQGLITEGFSWEGPLGTALLESNEGAASGAKPEFLRLRLARPNASGPLALSMKNSRGGATRASDLPTNVTRDADGNVYVRNLPMVDQGNKGYCLPASTQRIFEYYGIGADMHQIAQVAEADPTKGTSSMAMAKELDKIDFRFKTRLMIIAMGGGRGDKLTEVKIEKGEYYVGKPVDERKFLKSIQMLVDDGIPLLWSLELGLYREEPDLKPQTSGGHMRIIIGYNEKSEKIIFTDSWGDGHEFKTINIGDAHKASKGLFALRPTVR